MVLSEENYWSGDDCKHMIESLFEDALIDINPAEVMRITVNKYEHIGGDEEAYIYRFDMRRKDEHVDYTTRYFATWSKDYDDDDISSIVAWTQANSARLVRNWADGDTYTVAEVYYDEESTVVKL